MASIFTRIINGEIPSYKVAEDENFLAFLDINPLEKGHTLVVPKKEIDYIFDLDDETLQGMIVFAKRVAKKSRRKSLAKSGSSGFRPRSSPCAHSPDPDGKRIRR